LECKLKKEPIFGFIYFVLVKSYEYKMIKKKISFKESFDEEFIF